MHWVRPELVAEVKYLTWTHDNLLRQVMYEGIREDKEARDVRREISYPAKESTKPAARRAARLSPDQSDQGPVRWRARHTVQRSGSAVR